MKIGLITPGFSADADDWAIPALQNLASALAQRHTVHVFSLRYPTSGLYEWDGFVHTAIGGGQNLRWRAIKPWCRLIQAIRQSHQSHPFYVLHAFWADEVGMLTALSGRLIKRPVVISLAGWELAHLPHIKYGAQGIFTRRQFIKYALKRAKAV